MKKIFLSLLVITALFLFSFYPASAATDESEKEATPSQEIQDKIKERLEKSSTESAQIEIVKYYAWVGSLKKVDGQALIISTEEGEKTATVDNKTTILQTEKGKNRQTIKVSDLKPDNFIIAIGTMLGAEIKTLRIISVPPGTTLEKQVVYGEVTEVDEKNIKLSNGEKTTLPVNDKTIIKISTTAKAGKIGDIQLEDRIFAVVEMTDGKISATKSVFVLPGKNNPQASLEPSGSATPSAMATPSASPEE